MFDKPRYLRNVVFNWSAFAGSIVVGFLLSPHIVKNLGDARYGYWSLVVTATGFFSYFDLGIQSGVGHYLTRHLAEKDPEKLSDKVNSALTAFLFIGLIVFLIVCGVSVFFSRFFHVPAHAVATVRTALILMGLTTALKFPLSVFQAMLVGAQRFDIISGASLFFKVANAGLVLLVFRFGGGLLGMAATVACTHLSEALVLTAFSLRIVPLARLKLFAFRIAAFWELFHYGAFTFMVNIFSQIGTSFAFFIIGRKVSAEAVTHYSIGSELMPYMAGLLGSVTTPLLQVVIPMDVQGEYRAMKSLFLTGTRYVFCMGCLIAVNLLLVGHMFLGRWQGEKYLDPVPYGSSGTVLSIMTLCSLAGVPCLVAQQILFARRKNGLFAAFTFAENAAIILIALLLVPAYGIAGMALSILIPVVLAETLIIPILTGLQVGLRPFQYWKSGILPSVAVSLAVYFACRPVLAMLPDHGWATVFLSFTLVSVSYLACAIPLVVEKDHRIRIAGMLAEKLAWGAKAG